MRPELPPVSIRTPRFTLEGKSRAGNETWFRVRELGVALDIGRCPDRLVGLQHIFISHAHLDHALGVPFYFTQRKLQRLPVGTVYVPADAHTGFEELIRIHERLEGTSYEYRLVPVAPGQTVRLRRDLAVRAHRSTHSVSTNAYEFVEIRHKLLAELAGRPADEIADLRRRGGSSAIEDEIEQPLLFYTGDTDRGILEQNREMFRAEVLVIECSFTRDGDQDRGERYRHIHIDDIYEFAGKFDNRIIVLTHFSLRDGPREIFERISRTRPEILRGRLRLALPKPFQEIA
jgi:ribonuclease Z